MKLPHLQLNAIKPNWVWCLSVKPTIILFMIDYKNTKIDLLHNTKVLFAERVRVFLHTSILRCFIKHVWCVCRIIPSWCCYVQRLVVLKHTYVATGKCRLGVADQCRCRPTKCSALCPNQTNAQMRCIRRHCLWPIREGYTRARHWFSINSRPTFCGYTAWSNVAGFVVHSRLFNEINDWRYYAKSIYYI